MIENSFTDPDIRYIGSIVRYCNDITGAIRMFGSDEEDFLDNVQFQNSCAFAMIQIGEKVKRLSTHLTSKYSGIEWKEIARYRDMLSHNYDKMNLHMIWGTITEEIPLLKSECESILTDLK